MKRLEREGGDRRLRRFVLLQNEFRQPVDLRLQRLRGRVVVEHRLQPPDLVFLTVNFFTQLQTGCGGLVDHIGDSFKLTRV